jgi:hypothetical protein
MRKRSPSHKFDLHRVSDHLEAKQLLSNIWNIHFKRSFGTGRRGPKPKSPARQQFNVVMLNLYAAWKIDPHIPVAIALDNNHYKVGSRYNALHLSKLLPQLVHHLKPTQDFLTITKMLRKMAAIIFFIPTFSTHYQASATH